MKSHATHAVRAILLCAILLPNPMAAQHISERPSVEGASVPQLASARTAFAPSVAGYVANPWTPDEVQQPGQAKKDGTVAVLLSVFVFSGTGSFYAGNKSHGWRHVIIGLASLGLLSAGAVSCLNDSSTGGDCSSGAGLVGVGFLVYLGNVIWGGITAASDVRAANGVQESAPRKKVVGG